MCFFLSYTPPPTRELASRLGKTTSTFENWKDKLNNTDTSKDTTFKKLTSTLARDLDALVKLVNHAENSVKAVERQRSRFSHISDNELKDRRRYVTTTRREVRNMKEMTTSPKTRQKIQQDKQKKLFGNDGGGGFDGGGSQKKTYSEENKEFYNQQKMDQKEHRKQQDDLMDGMSNNVEALNTYAVAIGDELDEQKILLDEFGNEMATVQTRMDKVMGGMQSLLKTNNNNVICLIIFLTVVAAVLFFLVIYW